MINNYNWKAEFIKALADGRNIHSYLELGIDKCHTFDQISAPIKIGVDISTVAEGVITADTDSFFKNNGGKFDLVYIDACHEKNQTKRDFINSFNALNDDGIILFHDIHPNSLNDTKMTACGNVYELWIGIVNTFDVNAIINTLPNGKDGLGIFRKSRNKELIPFVCPDVGYEYYNMTREKYSTDISISIEELINT